MGTWSTKLAGCISTQNFVKTKMQKVLAYTPVRSLELCDFIVF